MNKSLKNKVIRKGKEKPSWDNTVSDLNAYKLTPEELSQRKIDHISKNQHINFRNDNISSTKPETVYDRLAKVRYGNLIKENETNQRKKIVEGMFTSDKELFELFEQSEKTLSSVESMFGDPMKRYRVNPTITPAPNFNGNIKNSNTNNSNSCALNDCSGSDNETSKSETKSQNNEDELSKFKKFIEHERKVEEAFEVRRNKKPLPMTGLDKETHIEIVSKSSVSKETITKSEVSTETDLIDQSNSILQYIYSTLTQSNCIQNEISNNNKDIADKIVHHLLTSNKKNNAKIELLNTELIQNKELIDALTLELINNSEQIKRMKNEYQTFSKNITSEISGIKTVLIKYLDQQAFSNVPLQTSSNRISNVSSSNSTTHHSVENYHNTSNNLYDNNTDEVLFNKQLNSLQIEHQETQKRLKNLLKIQDSISQMAGDFK